jgi:hypothetical protein
MDPYPDENLTDAQLRAVELLVTGRNDRQVAAEIGMHRVTIARWRLYNPEFEAALNRRRRELVDAARDGLRSVLSPALDLLAAQVGEGNWKVALALVRQLAPDLGRLDDVGAPDIQSLVDDLALARHLEGVSRPVVPAETRAELLEDIAEVCGDPDFGPREGKDS